jgi:hypothetical protein
MERRYALIAGNSIAAGQPFDRVWPVIELVELALLLRLELIELLGRIAGGVALDTGSRDKIRTAVNLLPILVDQFEIEISRLGQSPGVGGLERVGARGGLWVTGLAGAAGRQNRRQHHQCTHADIPLVVISAKAERSASIIVGLGSVNPANGAPEFKLIQVVLLTRLHLIELVRRITSGVLPDARSRDPIRSAVKLLAVLVD